MMNVDMIMDVQENGWLNMPNAWGAFEGDRFYNLFYGDITFIKTSNSVPAAISAKAVRYKIDTRPLQLAPKK